MGDLCHKLTLNLEKHGPQEVTSLLGTIPGSGSDSKPTSGAKKYGTTTCSRTGSFNSQSRDRKIAYLPDVSVSPHHDDMLELPPATPVTPEDEDDERKAALYSFFRSVCDTVLLLETPAPVQCKVSKDLLSPLKRSKAAL